MSKWHSRSGGAALVDETGKIIGEVRQNLANGECVNTATGERYIAMEYAKAAVERSIAHKLAQGSVNAS